MKRTKITMMTLAAAFIMAACGETKKEETTEEAGMPMQNEMHMEETGEHDMAKNLDDGQSGAVGFRDENKGAAYQHYMHIKTALVNTNAEEAQNGGKMMVEALAKVEDNTQALEAAKTIANSAEINEQRTAFQELSAAMEVMLKESLRSGEVYKQFCPMAFDGKGAFWLSASKEVRNPYYGDKMLKCGRVEATITGS
ncbi:DUF3347 domain-containing protein [Salinimicrobium oceani]|uniref:DUF3347 domain-containing protein n=1 Tax=Salinimicrobium oceani TaxID=2722702 RepID=A0ABX1CY23_9FLAO|nr:DUF3347 domain-containing protein [Salinimicrobium oceani]NJW53157.1 DUF3347 domain-containing protein [Salinimicrobium oceani]